MAKSAMVRSTISRDVETRIDFKFDGTTRGEKPSSMLWRLQPLHAPLPFTRQLAGILRAVVQIAILALFDAGQLPPVSPPYSSAVDQ